MRRGVLASAHDLPLALMVWPRLYCFDAHADTQEIAYQLAPCPCLDGPLRRATMTTLANPGLCSVTGVETRHDTCAMTFLTLPLADA